MNGKLTFKPKEAKITTSDNMKRSNQREKNTITSTTSRYEFNKIITYKDRKEDFRYKKII